MYSSAYVWAKILSYMEDCLGAVTVSAWFDDAEVVELNEEHLILYSSSDFRREIIRRRCTDHIQDALKEIFKSDAKLIVFGDKELDALFVKEATAAGFMNLKGHRSVGGMRASIYNAMPKAGVEALVAFMKEFEAKYSK